MNLVNKACCFLKPNLGVNIQVLKTHEVLKQPLQKTLKTKRDRF